jgi:hypothetical protein
MSLHDMLNVTQSAMTAGLGWLLAAAAAVLSAGKHFQRCCACSWLIIFTWHVVTLAPFLRVCSPK